MRLLAGTGAPSLSVPVHFRADPRASVPRCSFETLGVFAPLCLPLEFLGLSEPMEAQAMAWPHIYTGEDVVLVSEAGSGKTLAYLLPLIQRVWEAEERGETESGQVAVVVPTQDLAVQVLNQARQLCDGGPLTCADAAGNARGSHVLVGTPLTRARARARARAVTVTVTRAATLTRTLTPSRWARPPRWCNAWAARFATGQASSP